MKKLLLSTVAALFLALPFAYAHGDIKSLLERYIGWGDVQQIVYLFDHDDVTLELLSDPVMVDHDKAAEALEAFFKQYPPKSCVITNQGKHQDLKRFFNGVYEGENGEKFKAYFEAAIDPDEGEYHLTLLRLEK